MENNVRRVLLEAGIGDYNATIAIQFAFMTPSATDPQMPSIVLITEAIQRALKHAGANVEVTGRVDVATARALVALVGQRWNHITWYELLQAALKSQRAHFRVTNSFRANGIERSSTMSYLPVGDSDQDAVPSFTMTKIPGIAVPMNKPTLDLFHRLQRQLNRVAYARNMSQVSEDGRIGSDTVRQIKAVLGVTVGVQQAANTAGVLGNSASVLATSLFAPEKPPTPAPKPPAPPAVYNAALDKLEPTKPSGAGASIMDSLKDLSPTTMVALAAIAVGAGYFLMAPKKKGV